MSALRLRQFGGASALCTLSPERLAYGTGEAPLGLDRRRRGWGSIVEVVGSIPDGCISKEIYDFDPKTMHTTMRASSLMFLISAFYACRI